MSNKKKEATSISIDIDSLFAEGVRDTQAAKEIFMITSINNLGWYDKAMWDLCNEMANYRSIEAITGIPFGTCYSTRKKIIKNIQEGYKKFLKGELSAMEKPRRQKQPSTINHERMRAYLYASGKFRQYGMPKKTLEKEKVEKPKSFRSAARLTKSGEEKYIIILSTTDIEAMKFIAKKKCIKIKAAYSEAVRDYMLKFKKQYGYDAIYTSPKTPKQTFNQMYRQRFEQLPSDNYENFENE
jgi:hypothetical protein